MNSQLQTIGEGGAHGVKIYLVYVGARLLSEQVWNTQANPHGRHDLLTPPVDEEGRWSNSLGREN